MTTERDIEELFAAAGVPAPGDGLKERVLAATRRPRAVVPAPIKWAIAAAFMLGVMLNVIAAAGGGMPGYVARPAAARDENRSEDLTAVAGVLALARGDERREPGADLAGRTTKIDSLLKGGTNGA